METKNFLQVFGEVLVSDTARVKAATYTLRNEYYPHPESLSVLLQLVLSTQESPVRQLAASQARALVPKHWKSLAEVQRSQFRGQLLQGTLLEKDKRVQHATARVIVAIAKIDIEDGQWMELPDVLLEVAHNSQDPQPRQVSTYILSVSLENLGPSLMFKFLDMLVLFSKTIADSDVEVRINTMLALSRIAIVIDPENDQMSLEAIQNLIPQMVDVLKQAIDSDDMERMTQSFEVFQTLLTCDPQVLNTHIRELVIFMTELAGAKSLDEDARTQAISFLMQCVRYRKLKLQGLKLGEPITLTCLDIATELGDASSDDDDITTPPRSALSLLDILASTLPPSQVVVPLIHALGPYVNSDDPDRRQGGIMSLSMCVEGAPDFVSTQLHEILPLILRLLDDPELKVRRAALDAAMRLGEDVPEAWGKEHEKLVPALVKNMDIAIRSLKGPGDTPNLEIIRASCSAIESLVECMEAETIKPYLPELVPRLSRLFKHPHLQTKASAISAIGAIASTAKEYFLPYFQDTMNSLAEFVTIKDSDDELDLRCRTCDAMGSMALAVGAEAFEPFVRPLMDATGDALHLDHPKLKETSYLFWGSMAKVYGSEFKVFLDTVMKSLFESVEADESGLGADTLEGTDLTGKEITIGGKKITVATEEELDEMVELDGVDGVDDDDDDDDWDDFNTVTAVAQEKEIAVEVIGDIMTHVSQDGMPYLEKTIEIVLMLTDHFYEGVRRASIGTLFRVYAAIWQLQGEHVKKWKPGLPVENNLPAVLNKLGAIIMGATLALWEEEGNRSCVTDINRSIAATLKLCGPALISDPKTFKPLTEIVLALITKKHSCQQEYGEFDDMEDLEELSEYDWILVDTALDVVIALAISLGETFGQLWKTFEKPVVKLASSSEAIERSASVGVIAECIRGMGNQVTPFATSLLRLLLHRLNDEDPETKSNAAFATGLLVQNTNSNGDGEILKAFSTILAKLEPLFEMHKARAVDNAAGCVSRMIIKHQDHVPLGVVLPALLQLLPLKEDVEENEPIYTMIVRLYSSSEPTILSLTPQLLHVLDQVMAPPYDQLNDATREQLVQLVRFVHGKHPALLGEHETLTKVLRG